MRFRLMQEDSEKIKARMKKIEKTQELLTSALGFRHQAKTNAILNGRTRITQAELTKLYNFLDGDDSLSYLLDYEGRLLPAKDLSNSERSPEQMWEVIYDDHASRLKNNYLSLSLENRGKLLGHLENLTEEFSQESGE